MGPRICALHLQVYFILYIIKSAGMNNFENPLLLVGHSSDKDRLFIPGLRLHFYSFERRGAHGYQIALAPGR